jgi:N-acetylglucosaminyldiphosphoundecaprenol N-acetyl-beta-D-mannosaminyltransferase
MTVDDLTGTVAEGIRTDQKWLIANHNLHSAYLLHHEARFGSDQKLRSYFKRAKFTHVDGMSIVILGRLFGHEVAPNHRVAYTDWLPFLMREAVEKSWRVYYLGSAPDIVKVGAAKLRARFSGLHLKTHHGYFDPSSVHENEAVLKDIAAYKPDLLMVGMGMPRQERWIEENFDRLSTKVILASGAALDYVAGAIPTPPRWMGRVGLEWAYRLCSEPRRLGSRYLIEPWYLLLWLLQDGFNWESKRMKAKSSSLDLLPLELERDQE